MFMIFLTNSSPEQDNFFTTLLRKFCRQYFFEGDYFWLFSRLLLYFIRRLTYDRCIIDLFQMKLQLILNNVWFPSSQHITLHKNEVFRSRFLSRICSHVLKKSLTGNFILRSVWKWKTYGTLCGIWYHLSNFKKVKNTHGGVLLLVVVAG